MDSGRGVSASIRERYRTGRVGAGGVDSGRERYRTGGVGAGEMDSGRGVSASIRGRYRTGGVGAGGVDSGRGVSMDDREVGRGQGVRMDDRKLSVDSREVDGGPIPGSESSEEGVANGNRGIAEMSLGFEYEGVWQGDSSELSDEERIPSDPMLAETHYSQYDDFESDSSEDDQVGVF